MKDKKWIENFNEKKNKTQEKKRSLKSKWEGKITCKKKKKTKTTCIGKMNENEPQLLQEKKSVKDCTKKKKKKLNKLEKNF